MALQSFTEEMMELWDGWEIRVLVLLSLLMQVILILFGSQRKYTKIICIHPLVCLAYLTADMVATITLGCLAHGRGDSKANKILKLQAFWAPFLLLHLGGPDIITAYSLNDNELWLRHFFGYIFQVGLAFYVFIPSWNTKDAFRFIAIPVFIAGIIKYGERILVLYSSSAKKFKDSLISPSYEKHETEESKKKPTEEVKNYLVEAVSLFKKFRCLYADLILDHNERKESYSLLSSKQSAEEAFKLVAVELGFMYDVLYTKTTTIYSMFGIYLRCICLFSHISVSVVFFIIVDKSSYSPTDISITYLLLLGAVFSEFYAFIVLLLSDWTKLWLTKRKYTSIDTCSTGLLSNDNRRWSRSMGQYNLISLSLLESRKSKKSFNVGVQKILGNKELIDKYKYLSWKEVDNDLLEMIFKQLKRKSEEIKDDDFDMKRCKELLSQRGEYVSSKSVFINELIRRSTIGVGFDYSLLLWHITTDLCYYADFCKLREGQELPTECKISKWLSDYMLYLLVVCPTMLPKGISELSYTDTCQETIRFFKEKTRSSIETSAASLLDYCKTWDHYNKDSLSVLGHGCELAQKLVGDENGRNVKWKLISEVWIEMLEYAANHCGWKEHGQGLANGGELLTHVRLLMAHLGLSEQYQIQQQPIHHRWTTRLLVTAVDYTTLDKRDYLREYFVAIRRLWPFRQLRPERAGSNQAKLEPKPERAGSSQAKFNQPFSRLPSSRSNDQFKLSQAPAAHEHANSSSSSINDFSSLPPERAGSNQAKLEPKPERAGSSQAKFNQPFSRLPSSKSNEQFKLSQAPAAHEHANSSSSSINDFSSLPSSSPNKAGPAEPRSSISQAYEPELNEKSPKFDKPKPEQADPTKPSSSSSQACELGLSQQSPMLDKHKPKQVDITEQSSCSLQAYQPGLNQKSPRFDKPKPEQVNQIKPSLSSSQACEPRLSQDSPRLDKHKPKQVDTIEPSSSSSQVCKLGFSQQSPKPDKSRHKQVDTTEPSSSMQAQAQSTIFQAQGSDNGKSLVRQ